MERLARFDAQSILAQIEQLAEGRDAALLCFESPTDPAAWCHRGQVSAWLYDQTGTEVPEFGHEACGCGWQHPKLWRPDNSKLLV
jgi:hypothetical protein